MSLSVNCVKETSQHKEADVLLNFFESTISSTNCASTFLLNKPLEEIWYLNFTTGIEESYNAPLPVANVSALKWYVSWDFHCSQPNTKTYISFPL